MVNSRGFGRYLLLYTEKNHVTSSKITTARFLQGRIIVSKKNGRLSSLIARAGLSVPFVHGSYRTKEQHHSFTWILRTFRFSLMQNFFRNFVLRLNCLKTVFSSDF